MDSNNPQSQSSSRNKLPPIGKHYLAMKKSAKSKVQALQFSLQLMHPEPRHRVFSNDESSRLHKGQNTKKIKSSRNRTDSVSTEINLKAFESDKKKSEPNKHMEVTLQNFHKNIRINKEYIHRQIKKRREQQSNSNELKQNMIVKSNENKRILSPQYNQARRENKQRRSRRVVTEDSAIFNDIKQIIKSKMARKQTTQPAQIQNRDKLHMSNIRHAIKLLKFPKNTRNISPTESRPDKNKSKDVDSQNCLNSPVVLKNSQNYHEWRRVEISPRDDSPQYKASTFEMESDRLDQFVLRNQASLCKYFEYKKYLYFYQSPKLKTSTS